MSFSMILIGAVTSALILLFSIFMGIYSTGRLSLKTSIIGMMVGSWGIWVSVFLAIAKWISQMGWI